MHGCRATTTIHTVKNKFSVWMVLQVWVVTGYTRYSQGVAGAVTSLPLPPPLDHPHLRELTTRQHTRVSLQRFLLYFTSPLPFCLSLFILPFVASRVFPPIIYSRDWSPYNLLREIYFQLVATLSIHHSRYIIIACSSIGIGWK